jgi:hypothetical protein
MMTIQPDAAPIHIGAGTASSPRPLGASARMATGPSPPLSVGAVWIGIISLEGLGSVSAGRI